MENQLAAKKNYAIPIILGIIILLLIITVLLQNRHINRLDKALNEITLTEKKLSESDTETISSESIPGNISSEKNRSTEADNDCQDRIKKLEAKIADMQEWQDYLEKTMQKEKSGEAANNDRLRKNAKPALFSHFESFFEENNLSANKKSEFIELLIERDLELREARMNIANREDLQKEGENIKTNYDAMISNLLSEEEYIAYQEYEETQPERSFIDAFKVGVSDDNAINKQQEKDLLAALYRKRLDIENTMGIKELKSKGNPHSKEDIRKLIEYEKKVSDDYLEAARDILKGSQMKKFNEYIELQKISVKMMEKQLSQMPENSDIEQE